ncbi:MAG: negative regulator of flagellin synthesis FlgM [Gammaproteobacteria bacterium]|jgi:negative regulator of flagellin synthesis FlgM
MTDAINTLNRLQSSTIKSESQTRPEAGAGTASSGSKSTSSSGAAAIVELSNSNVLQDLNTAIQQLPEVNSAKVDSVKEALARGEYQPNAEVIAKKFSEIEKLLP